VTGRVPAGPHLSSRLCGFAAASKIKSRTGGARLTRAPLTLHPAAGGFTDGEGGKHRSVIELYQAEWCPHSRKVRERMTELAVDFVARQVEPKPEHRDELRRVAGTDEIPVLVVDAEPILGEDDIVAWLEERYAPGPDEDRHRRKFREHEVETGS
jgi:glutaredoxin